MSACSLWSSQMALMPPGGSLISFEQKVAKDKNILFKSIILKCIFISIIFKSSISKNWKKLQISRTKTWTKLKPVLSKLFFRCTGELITEHVILTAAHCHDYKSSMAVFTYYIQIKEIAWASMRIHEISGDCRGSWVVLGVPGSNMGLDGFLKAPEVSTGFQALHLSRASREELSCCLLNSMCWWTRTGMLHEQGLFWFQSSLEWWQRSDNIF